MKRALTLWAAALVLLALSGCSGKDSGGAPAATPESQQALIGQFRSADGALMTFLADGTLISSFAAAGRFSVDGDRLHYQFNGQELDGRRLSADVLTVEGKGTNLPPLKFYRLGSAAAQTPEAQTAPPRPPPERPKSTQPEPDRAVPLERYTAIEDFNTLLLVSAAFNEPPLTDEQKLGLLPAGATTTDAFARRDLIAQALPDLNRRLAALHEQRYYRLATTSLDFLHQHQPLPGIAEWAGDINTGRIEFGPYNLERHAFPKSCVQSEPISWGDPNVSVTLLSSRPTPGPCFLPVPDEATARVLEAKRAQGAPMTWTATVYFFVVAGSGAPTTRDLSVRMMHADISVLDGVEPHTVLARLPVDFSNGEH